MVLHPGETKNGNGGIFDLADSGRDGSIPTTHAASKEKYRSTHQTTFPRLFFCPV
jgi:hypothetical protein